MSRADTVLAGWSALAFIWWLLAAALVATAIRRAPSRSLPTPTVPSLTVFKPLPMVRDATERAALGAALESFIRQLDDTMEMQLGVPAEQEQLWRPLLNDWERRFPAARVQTRVQPLPRHRANPKVAWLEVLATQAQGDCWMWSDADITAPAELLVQMRAQLVASGAGAVTAPYCVRTLRAPPGMVDALFVNAEFLPGALLLGHLGPVGLSFGSAVLFRSEAFAATTGWEELGRCLADDHLLGQRLAPVEISPALVETCALQTSYAGAWRHLHRWQKTIRWCRPTSFAALLLILPLWGWLGRCVSTPTDAAAWVGLAAQYLMELVAGSLLTVLVSPRLLRGGWPVLLAWPVVRAGGWLAAWLPWGVVWNDPEAPWRSLRRKE